MFFILCKKLFSFSRYLNFCPDFFGHVVKQLDKKTTINFKIYDVTIWKTNNYNTDIPQYHKKLRQPDNKIKIFFMKNNTQNMVGKLVEDTFYKKKQN